MIFTLEHADRFGVDRVVLRVGPKKYYKDGAGAIVNTTHEAKRVARYFESDTLITLAPGNALTTSCDEVQRADFVTLSQYSAETCADALCFANVLSVRAAMTCIAKPV